MSQSVILVTGASSGFGLMAAKALAEARYTTYASMRDTGGDGCACGVVCGRAGAFGVETTIVVPGSFTTGKTHVSIATPDPRPRGKRLGVLCC